MRVLTRTWRLCVGTAARALPPGCASKYPSASRRAALREDRSRRPSDRLCRAKHRELLRGLPPPPFAALCAPVPVPTRRRTRFLLLDPRAEQELVREHERQRPRHRVPVRLRGAQARVESVAVGGGAVGRLGPARADAVAPRVKIRRERHPRALQREPGDGHVLQSLAHQRVRRPLQPHVVAEGERLDGGAPSPIAVRPEQLGDDEGGVEPRQAKPGLGYRPFAHLLAPHPTAAVDGPFHSARAAPCVRRAANPEPIPHRDEGPTGCRAETGVRPDEKRSTRVVTDERKRTKSDFCRPLLVGAFSWRKGHPIRPKRRFAALFSASGDVALHRAPNPDSYRKRRLSRTR